MAGQPSRENGRKGGRPKGTTGIKWRKTLDRELAREAYRQQVLERMGTIVEKQVEMTLAGDGAMARYITDQVIGAPERQKVTTTTTTDKQGNTTIVNEYY